MENKILLQDIAQSISVRTSSQKKDADAFVRNVFDVIVQYLQEDKIVKIKGLGTFKIVEVSGRDSVNVNTGERIHISGHSKITFTPDSNLRDQVNRPFADFDTIVINEGIDITEMERVPEQEEEKEGEESFEEGVSEVAPTPTEALVTDVEESPAEDLDPIVQEEVHTKEVLSTEEHTDEQCVAEDNLPEEQVCAIEHMGENLAQEVVQTDHGDSIEVAAATVEKSETEESVSVPDKSVGFTSGNSTTETSNSSDNKHIIYIERKSCIVCRLCFFLLPLTLMALSYLAGYQRWFCKDEVSQEKPTATVVAGQMTVSRPKPATMPDTIQPVPRPDSIPDVAPVLAINHVDGSSSTSAKPVKDPVPVAEPSAITTTTGVSNGNYEIVGTKCTHTVKSGEGLYRLARMYYNDMNMARYIIQYNNIKNPDLISEGTVLKIPEIQKR